MRQQQILRSLLSHPGALLGLCDRLRLLGCCLSSAPQVCLCKIL